VVQGECCSNQETTWQHGENEQNIQLFGQEMNLSTWAICKLNMFLHGFFNADIRKGDTLGEPQHVENGELMRFDRVIANPPFSLKNWGRDLLSTMGMGGIATAFLPRMLVIWHLFST
jgi:type I restriction enzyme M protein